MLLSRRALLIGGATSLAGAPLQEWTKKGRILEPGFAGTPTKDGLSAPCLVRLKNGKLRMYFWARQGGLNHVYAAECATGDPTKWELTKKEPMLGPLPTGNITDKGPGFPFILRRDDAPWLMYFCSWGSWARKGEISNRTSLAISEDEGITWKVTHEPLLPLGRPGSFDAGLTGSVYVIRTGKRKYRMWYSAGSHYADVEGVHRGIVHIGHATSEDGIGWVKTEKAVLSPRLEKVTPYEAVTSKPSVLIRKGTYHLWLSVFNMAGRGYRLNYARSRDGIQWERFADQEILPLTPGGFDSTNQSYAHVIEQGKELWMFYAGDRFGATGIGLATRKASL